MKHNPDEELLLDTVSKFITDLQDENERLRAIISRAYECLQNGNRTWEAMEILK